MLRGEAKRQYQRAYMRHWRAARRANIKTPGILNNDVRPKANSVRPPVRPRKWPVKTRRPRIGGMNTMALLDYMLYLNRRGLTLTPAAPYRVVVMAPGEIQGEANFLKGPSNETA